MWLPPRYILVSDHKVSNTLARQYVNIQNKINGVNIVVPVMSAIWCGMTHCVQTVSETEQM